MFIYENKKMGCYILYIIIKKIEYLRKEIDVLFVLLTDHLITGQLLVTRSGHSYVQAICGLVGWLYSS